MCASMASSTTSPLPASGQGQASRSHPLHQALPSNGGSLCVNVQLHPQAVRCDGKLTAACACALQVQYARSDLLVNADTLLVDEVTSTSQEDGRTVYNYSLNATRLGCCSTPWAHLLGGTNTCVKSTVGWSPHQCQTALGIWGHLWDHRMVISMVLPA